MTDAPRGCSALKGAVDGGGPTPNSSAMSDGLLCPVRCRSTRSASRARGQLGLAAARSFAGGAGHGHALSGTGLGSLLSLAGPLPGQPPGVDPLLRGPLVKEYGVVLGGARDAADLRHVLRPLDLPKADAPPVLGR